MKDLIIDFNKDFEKIIDNVGNYINELIKIISQKQYLEEMYEEIKNASIEFEKKCSDNNSDKEINTRKFFYKTIFDISKELNNVNFLIDIVDLIEININNVLKKNKKKENPYYITLIDTYMLTALFCVSNEDTVNARKYFNKSVKVGEDNFEESKKNYHDALNCAYTWVGYYLYSEENYKEALKCFEKVIELDNSVKDDPNYHLTEKDSVPNSIKYIEMIKDKIGKR